jgi:uncharacterized membrane protein
MSEQTAQTIIVQGSPREVFDLWADVESFPRFMKHIKSVTRTGDRSTHWVAEGPMGTNVEWDANTTVFEPGKRIGWNSDPGSGIRTSGMVTFVELPKNQTEVNVAMHYEPPAGKVGQAVAAVFSADPVDRLAEDLRGFKAYAEGRLAGTGDRR